MRPDPLLCAPDDRLPDEDEPLVADVLHGVAHQESAAVQEATVVRGERGRAADGWGETRGEMVIETLSTSAAVSIEKSKAATIITQRSNCNINRRGNNKRLQQSTEYRTPERMQLAGELPPAFLTFALWHLPVPVPGGGAGDAPAANQAVPERANEGGAALRGKRRGKVT